MMDYGDLISVIIPCYNRERSIERAVRGVLIQTYHNIELIVVDDASTDRSAAIVEAIDDPRLRLIRHKKNQGASAARNTGIEAARADLIAFQDSDDNWFPEKLAVQMERFCALPDDYVACFHTKIIYGRDIEGGVKRYGPRRASCVPGPGQRIESGDLSEALLWGNFMGPPTVLLKKPAFHATGGFDHRLKNNNDWDFNLRLSQQGPIAFIDEPLMIVYDSEDGISKRSSASPRSMIVIFGKLRRQGRESRPLARHALTIHRLLLLSGKPRSARRFLRKAIALDPARVDLYARFALSYAPGLYGRLVRKRRLRRRLRATTA